MNPAPGVGRRAVLGGALTLPLLAAAPAHAASWRLRWNPDPGSTGLNAFEGVEDDRAKSHPGVKHIYPQGGAYRFDMHTRDRDTSTDRQRQEVRGMRQNGTVLNWRDGETWRVTYSMYIPSSLKATTSFTHIFQTKMPGKGTSPLTVMSLRHVGSTPTVEFKIFGGDVLVGRVDLARLHNRWTDVEIEQRIGNSGRVRWVLRSGGSTLIDASKNGDTFLDDVIRPKWGIYRSLSDSARLENCHLLIRDLRGYQYV
ncbi:Tat pathway signal sequence domain protein [Amycolatopsis suaedae]|uniref:Tat pathway signal sequence domain protein n=1 Tax=Amycolatopsis suaedae TaxID=2510978 RepID=A0A4Q7J7P6_9PSEU|nr:Tat pathway signal sequence domain protein [Amycolatopsis suaedae]RZQ62822.1 Tat pathway signal sequence domain protein [Amycolatopsis suaedae]